MLAVDFAFLLCLFEKFFGTVFGTLFLATLRRLYLLAGWRVVIRTFSIRSSKVLVEDCQLNIDILLVLQHPALNSFFDLFPTAFVVNLDRKIIGDVNSSWRNYCFAGHLLECGFGLHGLLGELLDHWRLKLSKEEFTQPYEIWAFNNSRRAQHTWLLQRKDLGRYILYSCRNGQRTFTFAVVVHSTDDYDITRAEFVDFFWRVCEQKGRWNWYLNALRDLSCVLFASSTFGWSNWVCFEAGIDKPSIWTWARDDLTIWWKNRWSANSFDSDCTPFPKL